MADQTTFRQRYRISNEVARTIPAGIIALVLLIIAVIALPRTTAKTVESQSSSPAQAPGLENTTTGSVSNVPGAGTAGLRTNGSQGGPAATTGQAAGPNVYGSTNPIHVTSKFIPARGPGVTKTTMFVGVGYSSQSAAGDRAIGGAGAAPSYDARNVFNSVVD